MILALLLAQQGCPPVDLEKHLPIGAEASGRCTAVKTSYGCYAHVDGGRIIGRVCAD